MLLIKLNPSYASYKSHFLCKLLALWLLTSRPSKRVWETQYKKMWHRQNVSGTNQIARFVFYRVVGKFYLCSVHFFFVFKIVDQILHIYMLTLFAAYKKQVNFCARYNLCSIINLPQSVIIEILFLQTIQPRPLPIDLINHSITQTSQVHERRTDDVILTTPLLYYTNC